MTASSTARPAEADGHTFGVEEEFLLVDPASGRAVPHAPAVLARARRMRHPESATALHPELMATQLEVASGVCTSSGELLRQLRLARLGLATAAGAQGARLVSTATPPLSGMPPPVSEGDRFVRIAETYRGLIDDYQACGCHVHIGVGDRDTAVAVVNRLRPWLPTLLALSVNSPFLDGRDTGYGSWRMIQQSRFPGSGLPPRCTSAADHDDRVRRLVDSGVLLDPAMSFWLARPSPRLPTVELRVADAALTPAEAVLQAVLARALVRTALSDTGEGGTGAWDPDEQLGNAAVWSAARHGLLGHAVHPASGRLVPALTLVTELLAHVRPALEYNGDLPFVHRTLSHLLHEGTGAERQRRAGAHGSAALLRMLAEHTAPAPSASGPVPQESGEPDTPVPDPWTRTGETG